MKTNKQTIKNFPWKKKTWRDRTKAIAEIIPPEASIIELGGGFCFLKRILKKNKYKSIDIKKWNDITTKADFNKNEFPDMGLFDVIVCQGILEYIEKPENFLKTIHKYGRRLIISYWNGKQNIEIRKNMMTFEELDKLLKITGWEKIFERDFKENQKIFLCTKI